MLFILLVLLIISIIVIIIVLVIILTILVIGDGVPRALAAGLLARAALRGLGRSKHIDI